MAQFDLKTQAIVGTGGSLPVPKDDEVTRKLTMLIEGECEGLGPLQAASKFGYSKQRYFQLRTAFVELGAASLHSRKRGPKTHYRRTAEVVRQVIRHRFLDPDASAEVIAPPSATTHPAASSPALAPGHLRQALLRADLVLQRAAALLTEPDEMDKLLQPPAATATRGAATTSAGGL